MNVAGEERHVHPLMSVAVPIGPDRQRPIAALVFGYWITDELREKLSLTPLGRTGETYAFDAEAVMVSNPPHLEDLYRIGLLEPGQHAALRLSVRDPGRRLTENQPWKPEPRALSRTRMAIDAIDNQPGIDQEHTDLDGYRNYRGVWVVGAWAWFPMFDVGVATEMHRSEAYELLTKILQSSLLLVGLAILFGGTTAMAAWSNLRLQKAVRHARQLGQYTKKELIGQGGMGKVYRATHAFLRRDTAVKVLNGQEADPDTVARFEREVQLTSELTHPNTIQIYDFGRTPEDEFYYAMEFLPGLDLARLVHVAGPLGVARTVHILLQACGSLKEAHDRGLIHRDIKPSNIMVCERGGLYDTVKVLDFGLAKRVAAGRGQITQQGQIGGTPLYIAPERILTPDQVDARSDLYSLGCVAFYLLTGQDVFHADSLLGKLNEVLHTPPARPSQTSAVDLPAELENLVVACLQKLPENRPARIDDLTATLQKIAREHPWTQVEARRWWQQHEGQVLAHRRQVPDDSTHDAMADATGIVSTTEVFEPGKRG
jgi:serine/threonine protein kinase